MLGTKVLEIKISNFQRSVEMFKLMSTPYWDTFETLLLTVNYARQIK